jgi:predicted GTPase
MSLKTRWLLLFAWISLPFVALLIAGSIWLWQHQWGVYFAAGTAIVTIGSWPLIRQLQKLCTGPLAHLGTEKDPNWPPRAEQAWKEVEAFAATVNPDHVQFDKPETMWLLLRHVLELVAKKYYPDSDNALLETPIPHVLRVAELVTYDVRQAFSTHVPGAHILTINDVMRLQRLAQWAPTLNRMYRVASLAVNPMAALARELAGYVQGKVINASAQETKAWAVKFAIERAGFYAIQLYSGQLVLDDVAFNQPRSSTKQILTQVDRHEEKLAEDPLRMLLIGQVKAGKSSLINALFGETRSAVDVVPCTAGIEPHLLEKDGLNRALIFDSAGYADVTAAGKAFEAAREQVLKCDVILMVCSAMTAAREPDRVLLDQLRKFFQADPDRAFPAFHVVLTHIDQLRPFREWAPPYDISDPKSPKAVQIRAAVEAVTTDLAVSLDQVIPVCLAAGQNYNVDEALVPAIVEALPAAQRSRYLRCLREQKDEQYWDQLWQQSHNAGRVVFKMGMSALHQAGRKLDQLGQKFTKKD